MSKKKPEFPKVIRVGQTRATIYKTDDRRQGCQWQGRPLRCAG